LSPFVGTNEENDALDLRINPFQGEGMMKEGQASLQLKANHHVILG